jgi:hypothetical protein
MLVIPLMYIAEADTASELQKVQGNLTPNLSIANTCTRPLRASPTLSIIIEQQSQ